MLYIDSLIVALVLLVGVAVVAAGRRGVPGATPFVALCLAVAAWLGAYALELSSPSTEGMIFWRKVGVPPAEAVPVLWLLFVIIYTRRAQLLTAPVLGLLALYPLLTPLMVLSDPWHHLVWTRLEVERSGPGGLVVAPGPWLWLGLAVAYLCFAVGTVLLLRHLWETRHLGRWQAVAVLAGTLVPWLGNALSLAGLNPAPDAEWTPFAFAVSGLIYGAALFGFRLFDVVPVARSAVVEAMGDGVLVLDGHGRVVDMNPAAARILACSPREAVGQPAATVLAAHPALLDSPGEGRSAEIVVGAGAAARTYEGRVAALALDGGREGRLIVLRDVTRRKGVEAQLEALNADLEARVQERTAALDATLHREQAARAGAEAAQERLTFLAETSALLGSSLDYGGQLQAITSHLVPYLADWCALDLLDGAGRIGRVAASHRDAAKTPLIYDLMRRYPPDPSTAAGFYGVIRTGQAQLWPEVAPELLARAARDADHQALLEALGYRSFLCVPLAARGRVLGALTLVMAESGRHYTNDDLALAQDLARRAAQAVDNARLYAEAQAAIGIRDEFLSIASHELKTPLTSMQLAVQSLRRGFGSGAAALPPERVIERLATIEAQGKRLTRLINDLLDISRISAGRLELEKTPTDLAALVRRVAEQFHDELARAGCALELDVPAAVWGAWDGARLEQVVTNLLSNALKYGRGAPITVSVGAAGGHARLAVQDRGIGIAPADQARIFDRFERAVAAGRYGGIGLGLYIARQIVEAHGGTISVASAPGQGATFTVTLPCEE